MELGSDAGRARVFGSVAHYLTMENGVVGWRNSMVVVGSFRWSLSMGFYHIIKAKHKPKEQPAYEPQSPSPSLEGRPRSRAAGRRVSLALSLRLPAFPFVCSLVFGLWSLVCCFCFSFSCSLLLSASQPRSWTIGLDPDPSTPSTTIPASLHLD